MYYRPEQWGRLDKKTLAYLDEKGLRHIYERIVIGMEAVWEMLDHHGIDLANGEEYDSPAHPLNFIYESAWVAQHQCFGMYKALLIFANEDGREDISHDLYEWGHYGLFY